MSKSIFSTYHNAENRVTSTILAVLERLSTSTLSAVFRGIEGESDFKMIAFENQQPRRKRRGIKPSVRIKSLRICGYSQHFVRQSNRICSWF